MQMVSFTLLIKISSDTCTLIIHYLGYSDKRLKLDPQQVGTKVNIDLQK